MKIKTLVCSAISAVAIMLMSTTAFAATSLYFGEVTKDGDVYSVPVKFDSSDYTDIYGFTADITYDSSKYALAGKTAKKSLVSNVYDDEDILEFTVNSTDGKLRIIGEAGSDAYPDTLSIADAAKFDPLFSIEFKSNSDTFDINDIGLTIISISQKDSGKAVSVDASEIGTYLAYSIAKDESKYGFIYGLRASVTINDTTKTADLLNYYEDGNNCVFIVKINPPAGVTKADVVIEGKTATTEDESSATWKELETITNVPVQRLNG